LHHYHYKKYLTLDITMRARQSGFTLIEIAIVLVIIGLLLGGVLKGQELIANARVRNIISQQDGIKAAYFGFQDRYRGIAGDYLPALAIQNIPGMTGCAGPKVCGGNGNGLIEAAGTVPNENIAAWLHLSLAGFVTGNYDGIPNPGATVETATNSPTNPYGGFMQVIFDSTYQNNGGISRNNVKTGAGIPATLLAEVDRKIDDGNPTTGEFRFSSYGGALAACVNAANQWDINSGVGNCGGASLF
jgi:prepilin-type N-terminal cleavage/methylation domain-containing protein